MSVPLMLPFMLMASLLTVICRYTDILSCIKLQSYTSTALSTGAPATLFATATRASTSAIPVEYSVSDSHGRAETGIATSRLMSVVDSINFFFLPFLTLHVLLRTLLIRFEIRDPRSLYHWGDCYTTIF